MQHIHDEAVRINNGLERIQANLLQPMSASILDQLRSMRQDDRQAWVLLEVYAGSGTHSSWASIAMHNSLIQEGKQPSF